MRTCGPAPSPPNDNARVKFVVPLIGDVRSNRPLSTPSMLIRAEPALLMPATNCQVALSPVKASDGQAADGRARALNRAAKDFGTYGTW